MPFEEIPGGFRRVGSNEQQHFRMVECLIESEPPNISAINLPTVLLLEKALQQYAPHFVWEWSRCVDLVSRKSSFFGYQNQELQQKEKDQKKIRGFYASLEVVFNERSCSFEFFKQGQFVARADSFDDLVVILTGNPQL